MPEFTWNLDPAILHIGSYELRYYSLLFVGVFLGGYALLNWQVQRGGGDEEDAGDFIVYGVLGVLLGARLGHVLFYDLEATLENPLRVFEIWKGGLASHGAVIGLILAMFLYTRRRGIPFVEGSDRFVFSAALGATLVRLGNFFNSEIVGRVTDQTWGVRFPRYDKGLAEVPLRHPSQLYEAALGLVVLGLLYWWDKFLGKERRPRGALISFFFLTYFPGRFLVEYFKEYQTLPPDSPLTMGQYLSIPGVLIGLYGTWWAFKRRHPVGWDIDEDYDDEDEDEPPAKARKRDIDPDVEEELAELRGSKQSQKKSSKKKGSKKKGSKKGSGKKTSKSSSKPNSAKDEETPVEPQDSEKPSSGKGEGVPEKPKSAKDEEKSEGSRQPEEAANDSDKGEADEPSDVENGPTDDEKATTDG